MPTDDRDLPVEEQPTLEAPDASIEHAKKIQFDAVRYEKLADEIAAEFQAFIEEKRRFDTEMLLAKQQRALESQGQIDDLTQQEQVLIGRIAAGQKARLQNDRLRKQVSDLHDRNNVDVAPVDRILQHIPKFIPSERVQKAHQSREERRRISHELASMRQEADAISNKNVDVIQASYFAEEELKKVQRNKQKAIEAHAALVQERIHPNAFYTEENKAKLVRLEHSAAARLYAFIQAENQRMLADLQKDSNITEELHGSNSVGADVQEIFEIAIDVAAEVNTEYVASRIRRKCEQALGRGLLIHLGPNIAKLGDTRRNHDKTRVLSTKEFKSRGAGVSRVLRHFGDAGKVDVDTLSRILCSSANKVVEEYFHPRTDIGTKNNDVIYYSGLLTAIDDKHDDATLVIQQMVEKFEKRIHTSDQLQVFWSLLPEEIRASLAGQYKGDRSLINLCAVKAELGVVWEEIAHQREKSQNSSEQERFLYYPPNEVAQFATVNESGQTILQHEILRHLYDVGRLDYFRKIWMDYRTGSGNLRLNIPPEMEPYYQLLYLDCSYGMRFYGGQFTQPLYPQPNLIHAEIDGDQWKFAFSREVLDIPLSPELIRRLQELHKLVQTSREENDQEKNTVTKNNNDEIPVLGLSSNEQTILRTLFKHSRSIRVSNSALEKLNLLILEGEHPSINFAFLQELMSTCLVDERQRDVEDDVLFDALVRKGELSFSKSELDAVLKDPSHFSDQYRKVARALLSLNVKGDTAEQDFEKVLTYMTVVPANNDLGFVLRLKPGFNMLQIGDTDKSLFSTQTLRRLLYLFNLGAIEDTGNSKEFFDAYAVVSNIGRNAQAENVKKLFLERSESLFIDLDAFRNPSLLTKNNLLQFELFKGLRPNETGILIRELLKNGKVESTLLASLFDNLQPTTVGRLIQAMLVSKESQDSDPFSENNHISFDGNTITIESLDGIGKEYGDDSKLLEMYDVYAHRAQLESLGIKVQITGEDKEQEKLSVLKSSGDLFMRLKSLPELLEGDEVWLSLSEIATLISKGDLRVVDQGDKQVILGTQQEFWKLLTKNPFLTRFLGNPQDLLLQQGIRVEIPIPANVDLKDRKWSGLNKLNFNFFNAENMFLFDGDGNPKLSDEYVKQALSGMSTFDVYPEGDASRSAVNGISALSKSPIAFESEYLRASVDFLNDLQQHLLKQDDLAVREILRFAGYASRKAELFFKHLTKTTDETGKNHYQIVDVDELLKEVLRLPKEGEWRQVTGLILKLATWQGTSDVFDISVGTAAEPSVTSQVARILNMIASDDRLVQTYSSDVLFDELRAQLEQGNLSVSDNFSIEEGANKVSCNRAFLQRVFLGTARGKYASTSLMPLLDELHQANLIDYRDESQFTDAEQLLLAVMLKAKPDARTFLLERYIKLWENGVDDEFSKLVTMELSWGGTDEEQGSSPIVNMEVGPFYDLYKSYTESRYTNYAGANYHNLLELVKDNVLTVDAPALVLEMEKKYDGSLDPALLTILDSREGVKKGSIVQYVLSQRIPELPVGQIEDVFTNRLTDETSTIQVYTFISEAIKRYVYSPETKLLYHLITTFPDVLATPELHNFLLNELPEMARLPIEKVKDYIVVSHRIIISPSGELRRIKDQLLRELMKTDNPLEYFNQIEDVFIRNNLPTVGKVFKIFNTLFNAQSLAARLVDTNLSPELRKLRFDVQRRGLILSDLVKIHVKSGNISLKEYLRVVSLGSELMEKIRNGIPLTEQESATVTKLLNKLDTLYANSLLGMRSGRETATSSDQDLSTRVRDITSEFRVGSQQTISQRLTEMYLKPIGVESIEQAIDVMKAVKQAATERNVQAVRNASDGRFTFASGDLIKGVINSATFNAFDKGVRHLENMLQNGIVAKEYLGADSGQDATPFDTDAGMVKTEDAEQGFSTALINSPANGYGDLLFVFKNRGQFYRSDTADAIRPPGSEYELFHTGVVGERHFGVRTGIPSTEIDFVILKTNIAASPRLAENVYYMLAQQGFYVPAVDETGKILFTPEMYEEYRHAFDGIEKYDGSPMQIVRSAESSTFGVQIKQIASQIEQSGDQVKLMQQELRIIVQQVLESFGITLKPENEGGIYGAELHNIGSTGRGTNLPGDFDYDFTLLLDEKGYAKANEISVAINKALSFEKLIPSANDNRHVQLRFGGVVLSNGSKADVDIGINTKSEDQIFGSHNAIEAKLDSIASSLGEPIRREVVANILLTKKLLKAANAYKKGEMQDGGLGGIGVENWILSNGGSIDVAFKSFWEAAHQDGVVVSLDEFRKRYKIFDAGMNLKRELSHDNYTYVLTQKGYEAMLSVIGGYVGGSPQK